MPTNRQKPARRNIAFLQYTGGTTGLAKGATLTHFNVAANVAQLDAWMGRTIAANKQNVMNHRRLPLYLHLRPDGLLPVPSLRNQAIADRQPAATSTGS